MSDPERYIEELAQELGSSTKPFKEILREWLLPVLEAAVAHECSGMHCSIRAALAAKPSRSGE